MTNDPYGDFHRKVRDFHQKMGFNVRDVPGLPGQEVDLREMMKRLRLIYEEAYELMEAIDQNEFDKLIDAYADLLYVVIGTGVTLGLPTQALFDEVHRSNMTKTGMNEHSKGGKGEGYEEPKLMDVVDAFIAQVTTAPTPMESGLCCMKEHANAIPPWTCSCSCHEA